VRLTRRCVFSNKSKAVIFLTGHTHMRAYSVLDPMAISMESGKYLDTVGLVGCSTAVRAHTFELLAEMTQGGDSHRLRAPACLASLPRLHIQPPACRPPPCDNTHVCADK
jgi:hypothetical protein